MAIDLDIEEAERSIPELEPLESANIHIRPTARHKPRRQPSRYSPYSPSCYRAPLRVFKLLALLILLPSLFIMVPLYMRYRVYSSQMYPMGMTDMRLIDGKISPTWCQRQVVRANTTFNAFVVPESPELAEELVPVSMSREMEMEDDMKEYWGFYLLQGSTVTVSACVSVQGASLVMIKGYKHLKECAYIGDDSSEEIEELTRAYQAGLLPLATLRQKQREKENQKTNDPDTMKRHKAGVSFHDPTHSNDTGAESKYPADEDGAEPDPKELREILEHLHAVREAAKEERARTYQPPANILTLPAQHRHRNANVDRDERKFITFNDLDGKGDRNSTEQDNAPSNAKTGEIVILKLNKHVKNNESTVDKTNTADKTIKVNIEIGKEDIIKNKNNSSKVESIISINRTENVSHTVKYDNTNKSTIERVNAEDFVVDLEGAKDSNKNQTVVNNKGNSTENVMDKSTELDTSATSREIFEEVLERLQKLGDRGKRVLKRLHHTMGMTIDDKLDDALNQTTIMEKILGTDEELDRLRKILVEAIDEEKTKPERKQKRKESMLAARTKRQLWIGMNTKNNSTTNYEKDFNLDDEERNYAAEEDIESDGLAEAHERVNETTPLDMSNSEFWSSFSSSEEALMECEGLILNLPLTPDRRCSKENSEQTRLKAAQKNAVTYRVPANGYYFFVFNSENEVQRSYLSVKFDLEKTRYDIARTALRECRNSTERCDLNLDIFSAQKVVLELPLRDNESLWNEQIIVISECEPRTSIYLACAIAVPLLIMIFAFQ